MKQNKIDGISLSFSVIVSLFLFFTSHSAEKEMYIRIKWLILIYIAEKEVPKRVKKLMACEFYLQNRDNE